MCKSECVHVFCKFRVSKVIADSWSDEELQNNSLSFQDPEHNSLFMWQILNLDLKNMFLLIVSRAHMDLQQIPVW